MPTITTPDSNTLLACPTLEIIRGSGFQMRISLPADDLISWTGSTGSGRITKEDGTVAFTFDAGSLTVEDDGSATMVFTADGTDTLGLTAGIVHFASWRITTSGSLPFETRTFRVAVFNSPMS
jgi:hypothetical protein